MKRQLFSPKEEKQSGQSLVEIALLLPLLLALLLGVIEVGNLLITQNRVNTAANSATSYGVANYSTEALPANWDTALAGVALNSVHGTNLDDEDKWQFAFVRATTNDAGDGFARFEVAYPHDGAENFPDEETMRSQILEDLGGAGARAANLELLVTVAHSGYDSILRLDSFFNAYPTQLTAYNIGLLDIKREMVEVCLVWEGGEGTDIDAQYFRGAIDYHGEPVHSLPTGPLRAERTDGFHDDSEYDGYLTRRVKAGGNQIQVVYDIENKGFKFGDPPLIKFDYVSGGSDGLKDNGDADLFLIVVPGVATSFEVESKSGPTNSSWHQLGAELNDWVRIDESGEKYRIHVAAVDSNSRPGETMYLMKVVSEGVPHALSHITFRVEGYEEETPLECVEWGIPEDVGTYTDMIDN